MASLVAKSHELPRRPDKPPWNKIRKRPRTKYPTRPLLNPETLGWDTETTREGYAFILANGGWYMRLREPKDLDRAVGFLARQGRGGIINSFWHMDFDVGALFKWQPDKLEDLYPPGNEQGETRIGEHHLTYLREKCLTIRSPGNHVARFYDANLFYLQPLARAAKTYLGREAPELKGRRHEDLTKLPLKEVSAYCMWDAQAAGDLMKRFLEGLGTLDFHPRKPISPGFVAKDFLGMGLEVPTWHDSPGWVNGPAWEAFRGGWIDLWKRGTTTAWVYDVNAAYPSALRDLPDTRKGTWTRELLPQAELGFVKCRIRTSPDTPPAISAWLRAPKGIACHVYPWLDTPARTWLTLTEWRILQKLPGVHLDAYSARCFVPRDRDPPRPYREAVDKLRAHKEAMRGDDAAYLAAKNLYNSLYGNAAERTPVAGQTRAGRIMNPVYAAETTARTRAIILEALLHNDPTGKSVIGIATDGLLTTKPFNLQVSDQPGEWSVVAEAAEGVFAYPGIYEYKGKRAHHRGFRIARCICTHLSKDHAMKPGAKDAKLICAACPCKDFTPSLKALLAGANGKLVVEYERPYGAREAIKAKHAEWTAKFHPWKAEKRLAIYRRIWTQAPQNFQDLLTNLYESQPVPFSFILQARSQIKRNKRGKP